MPLINCEINLILIWSTECVISGATGVTKFSITLYSNSNFINSRYTKLLQQIKSGFKRTVNWNKDHPKVTTQPQNQFRFSRSK